MALSYRLGLFCYYNHPYTETPVYKIVQNKYNPSNMPVLSHLFQKFFSCLLFRVFTRIQYKYNPSTISVLSYLFRKFFILFIIQSLYWNTI